MKCRWNSFKRRENNSFTKERMKKTSAKDKTVSIEPQQSIPKAKRC